VKKKRRWDPVRWELPFHAPWRLACLVEYHYEACDVCGLCLRLVVFIWAPGIKRLNEILSFLFIFIFLNEHFQLSWSWKKTTSLENMKPRGSKWENRWKILRILLGWLSLIILKPISFCSRATHNIFESWQHSCFLSKGFYKVREC